MADKLAQHMFEASDLERHRIRGGDLRRFHALPIAVQDEWEAAARDARKRIGADHAEEVRLCLDAAPQVNAADLVAVLRALVDKWSQ